MSSKKLRQKMGTLNYAMMMSALNDTVREVVAEEGGDGLDLVEVMFELFVGIFAQQAKPSINLKDASEAFAERFEREFDKNMRARKMADVLFSGADVTKTLREALPEIDPEDPEVVSVTTNLEEMLKNAQGFNLHPNGHKDS